MTQLNLLPPEIRTRQRIRRYTFAAAGAVGAAVVLVLSVFVLQSLRLAAADRELAAQRQRNTALQSSIAELRPFEQLKADVAAKEALVSGLVRQRVPWSAVLRDVSSALPGELWLTGMSGQLGTASAEVPGAPAPEGVPVAATSGVIGSLQFQGVAFDHPTVGRWLTRLEQVRGWVNAWVTSSARQDAGTGRKLVNFTNSVDLTAEVATDGRQK